MNKFNECDILIKKYIECLNKELDKQNQNYIKCNENKDTLKKKCNQITNKWFI